MKERINVLLLIAPIVILFFAGTFWVQKTAVSQVDQQLSTPNDRLYGDFNLNQVNWYIDQVNRLTSDICERTTKNDSLIITLVNELDSSEFNRIYNHGEPTGGRLSFFRYEEENKHFVTFDYDLWSSILQFIQSNLPNQQ
jgi:hypothetical protein